MEAFLSAGLKSYFLRLLLVIISWKADPLRIVLSEPVSMIPHTGTPSICISTHFATVGVDMEACNCKCVTDGKKSQ